MPEGVPKEKFLTITKAWKDLVHESLDDIRTCAMMGAIQKHIPEFFKWLEKQKAFQKVRDVRLHEFILTMGEISNLGETSLTKLIKNMEAPGHENKAAKGPDDNPNL